MVRSWSGAALLAASLAVTPAARAGGESPAPRWHLDLTVGVSTLHRDILEYGKGTGTRVSFGRSPLVGATLSYGTTLKAVLGGTYAFARDFSIASCLYRYPEGCPFDPPEAGGAQSWDYAAGAQVVLSTRRVRPYAGGGFGAVTWRYTVFEQRVCETRGAWYAELGLRVRVARHELVIAARRSSLSNPPWGLDGFADYQIQAGVGLALDGGGR